MAYSKEIKKIRQRCFAHGLDFNVLEEQWIKTGKDINIDFQFVNEFHDITTK